MKTKKNIDDKMPTEDVTVTIISSGKLLVRSTGMGASFGTEPP